MASHDHRDPKMNLKDLHQPFPPNEIEWRVGSTNQEKTSGLALAYLTARHVMERLDEVCGAENWATRYEFHGSRTICYLSIKIGLEWVTKADGAGDSDVEAEKGAISDALKRAAVHWGIGRYLYELGSTWVDIDPAGKSFRIKKDQYSKLESTLRKRFGEGYDASGMAGNGPTTADQEPLDDTLAKKVFPALQDELLAAATLKQLQGVWERWLPLTVQFSPLMQENVDTIHHDCTVRLQELGGDGRAASRDVIEADLRSALSLDDLEARWRNFGPALKKLSPADVAALAAVGKSMKETIGKMGGKMPAFSDLTQEQKIAGTP